MGRSMTERVIQEKTITEKEISTRWHHAINERLTIDEVTATKLVQDRKYTELIKGTWEPARAKQEETRHTSQVRVRF